MHSYLKNFQARAAMSKVFCGCWSNLLIHSFSWQAYREHETWTVSIAENVMLLVTSCPVHQPGASTVSTWNFKEYWSCLSSFGWIIPWPLHSHPPRGRQCAYSLADVFSGSVATQLRWGEKLWTQIKIFRILRVKNYEHHFKLLWVTEENVGDTLHLTTCKAMTPTQSQDNQITITSIDE